MYVVFIGVETHQNLVVNIPHNQIYRREHVTGGAWYIKVNGEMKGPFPSWEAANASMLNEGIAGQIVQGTADGKELLFG